MTRLSGATSTNAWPPSCGLTLGSHLDSVSSRLAYGKKKHGVGGGGSGTDYPNGGRGPGSSVGFLKCDTNPPHYLLEFRHPPIQAWPAPSPRRPFSCMPPAGADPAGHWLVPYQWLTAGNPRTHDLGSPKNRRLVVTTSKQKRGGPMVNGSNRGMVPMDWKDKNPGYKQAHVEGIRRGPRPCRPTGSSPRYSL